MKILRQAPQPYQAMLAICSDLDETPDRHVYWEIMRFLNTTETTSMGPGVGLEVGNTIYFDMPTGQFAYWNTDDAGRAMVRAMIQSGHIDCLHSYGDSATTRKHAGRALDELVRHDCRLEVWVDHGTAPTNFGADIMRGHGDEQGHEAYHADLTCGYGVRYVWLGRVTSVIGQDARRSLLGLFNARHPLASLRTVTKEWTKGMRARRGDGKYAMHGLNQLMRATHLRDGQPVHEFIRCNPHWGGVSYADTAGGLADVLTPAFLDRLVAREGTCVLYTHLGKTKNPRNPLEPAAIGALQRLADYHRRGLILVTTTRRLLAYRGMLAGLTLKENQESNGWRIELIAGYDKPRSQTGLSGYDGLTLYAPESQKVRVMLNGRELTGLGRNGPDHTGRCSISLPWRPLEFPEI